MVFNKAKRILNQPIRQVFSLEWPFASNMHGTCYRVAADKTKDTSGEMKLVWVTRRPLQSEEQRGFFAHVQALRGSGVCSELTYGVDAAGLGYVAIRCEFPQKLDFDKPSALELRRRFLLGVLEVEKLHASGVALGTLTHESFIIERNNKVRCIEVLGGIEVSTFSEAPVETRIYFPLDGVTSGWPSQELDVRCLAIIGMKLFGAQFPPSGIVVDEFPSYLERMTPEAPVWVGEVLEKIVRQPERVLYKDASALLGAILGSEKSAERRGQQGIARGGSDTERDGLSLDELVQVLYRRSPQSSATRVRRLLRSPTRKVCAQVVAVCGCVGLVTAGYSWLQEARRSAQSHTPGAGIDLALGAFSLGGDAGSGSNPAGSKEQEEAFDDARAQGLSSLVALVRAGDGAAEDNVVRALRESALEMLSTKLNAEERGRRLIEFEGQSPEIATRFAAALVVNFPELESVVREILLRGVRRLLPEGVAHGIDQFSTCALVLAVDLRDEVAVPSDARFGTQLSDAELQWLLSFHAKKRSAKVKSIAEIAVARELVSWPNRIFLEFIGGADVASSPPYEALLRGALGQLSVLDISQISSWHSPLGERSLYAALVSAKDPDTVRGALNGLIGTPMSAEPAVAPLIDVLRRDDVVDVLAHACVIGAIGLVRDMPSEVLASFLSSEALTKLSPPALAVLVEQGSSELIQRVLAVAGGAIHPDTLIGVLEHEDPAVRKALIPHLKNLPLASSRARVQKIYSLERDPAVVELYRNELGME
jgi:hypothetical protein